MSEGALNRLSEDIDALADVDVDTLTSTELDALVIGLMRARHRLAGVTAGPLARWDTAGVWRSDGSRSAGTRLARDCSTSPTTAHVELRRARKLTAMPATAAAVVAGRVSMDLVDLLGRADQPHRHHLFARDEQVLVDQCAGLRHAEAQQVVDYWTQVVDGEADEPAPSEPASCVHASTTFAGTVRVDGLLNRIDGAVFTAELDRLEREQYLADQTAATIRSAGERRAAALVEMATRSASTPADAQRPKPLFTVLFGDDSFTRMCELANGTVIAPDTLVPYLGEAELETILFDGPSTVIAASPARTFTGRLRRAIEVRDRHCQHPSGCDVPASACDVDHIIPHADGGPTDQFNGRLECRPHNRDAAKHDHDAMPHPRQPISSIDRLRALIRWRQRLDSNDADDGDPDEPAA